ncbi:MAG: PD40 domain-containing protein [Bryobacterales bacterium]|nr:PD40 domain-containing protein [Bryobacterales bacterium]
MYKSAQIAIALTAAAFAGALLAPVPGLGQSANDEKARAAEKAKAIARQFEANARTLTIYDRQGKVVTTVGKRAIYNTPVFSPDAKRLVAGIVDLEKEKQDLWVFDISTGGSIQLTSGEARETSNTPAWSPDGSRIAYVGLRSGAYGLYQKASNGQGAEELIYKLPGVGTLTDWSQDGRYLTYFSTDLGGGILNALPLNSSGERKPIEAFRSGKQAQGNRLSPDGRFMSYFSNESGKNEIYVRPFDPAGGSNGMARQVSDQGGQGMAFWRRDGKELYYLGSDRSIMAVSVSTSPELEIGKPKVLFHPPEEIAVSPGSSSVSRDGERFVIAVPPSRLRQLTILDRQGKVVKTVGEPGVYFQPAFSPDGNRVAVTRNDPKTGNNDIWTFDVASGKGYAVTNDVWPDNSPIWSADGKQVAYVSTRELYSGIYRKAWDGSGQEELLFRYTPGAGIGFSDWSQDGKFLTFATGVLLVVPLAGKEKALDRKALEWMRDENNEFGGRFSPDMRYLAYGSDQADPLDTGGGGSVDIYVRPFDASKPETPGPGPAVRVTQNGVQIFGWRRQDGKELIYMNRDFELWAMDVSTTPTFRAGTPKLLFKLASPQTAISPDGISRDGQRFVFGMPVSPGAR